MAKLDARLIGGIGLILTSVLAVEGGYVFDPDDPGGETNLGVTKAVAVKAGYTGPMKALTEQQARAIYWTYYVEQPGFVPIAKVDVAVAEEVIDTAVNMGPPRPSKFLQQTLNEVCASGLTVDGRIGAKTVAALEQCEGWYGRVKVCVAVLDGLDARQKAEYLRLIQRNPKLAKFRKGWLAHRIGNVDRKKCAA